MKLRLIIPIIFFGWTMLVLVSCLEGDDMNTPPGGEGAFIMMTNNPAGGTLVNSGLRYFGNQALTYPPTNEADTAIFAVTLQGAASMKEDITVTLATPSDALDDYYYGDSLVYEMMPDDLFDILNSSAVIKAGSSHAEFKVKFYPSRFDPTKNYMLPITATNDAGLPISSNYGFVYYHVIGNPIAGAYDWYYRRYNNADTVGATAGTVTNTALFGPKNGTTIEVLGGYASTVGLNAPYVVTFKNTAGVITDLKVTINPDLAGGLTENGITITKAPIFVKSTITPTKRYFKIMYQVHNGAAFRTLLDEYTWTP